MTDPDHPPTFLDRTLLMMGHLSAWPCFYILGVVIYWSTLTQRDLGVHDLLFVALLAHAVYTLDRVKQSNTRWDPADFAADPERHTLIRSRATQLRALVLSELAACGVIALATDPVLFVPLIGSLAVTLLYAGSPAGSQRRRLKDVVGLKSPLIASGIIALSIVMTRGSDPILPHVTTLDPVITLGLFSIVFGDAVLCDLGDRAADLEHGTPSIPVTLGPRPASVIGVSAIVLGSVMLCMSNTTPLPLAGRTSISAMLIASAVLSLRTQRVRDWVDARMLPVVLFGLWLAA